jgi:FtsZ-binding cell division protein ZapB
MTNRYKLHYALHDQSHDNDGNGFHWTWFDEKCVSREMLEKFYSDFGKEHWPVPQDKSKSDSRELKPDDIWGGIVQFDHDWIVIYRYYNGGKDKQNRPNRFVLLTAWLKKIHSTDISVIYNNDELSKFCYQNFVKKRLQHVKIELIDGKFETGDYSSTDEIWEGEDPDFSMILKLPIFEKLSEIKFAEQIPIPPPSWDLSDLFPLEIEQLQQQNEQLQRQNEQLQEEKEFLLCKQSAEQGDADSQYWLGIYYLKGTGTESSPQKAVEWFTKAAEQENAEAYNKLGECYKNGNGISQNKYQALVYFLRSALKGNAEGQYNFGEYLQLEFQPFKWFEKSAEQRNAKAQYKLGKCYENGEFVEKNIENAKKFYRQAAEQGHKLAKEAIERLNEKPAQESQK